MNLIIKPNSLHLWHAHMPDFFSYLERFYSLLNPQEIQRAQRFHFDRHRDRFVVARGILRLLMQDYTDISAKEVKFANGEHGKPYLVNPPKPLYFNVSHSHDMAVYAFTESCEVGVDVEKVEENFHDGVAKRFFSAKEYAELSALPDEDRRITFYRIWAAKEAVIKALGTGLYIPLADFSVDIKQSSFETQVGKDNFFLEHFAANAEYQSAFAMQQKPSEVVLSKWTFPT